MYVHTFGNAKRVIGKAMLQMDALITRGEGGGLGQKGDGGKGSFYFFVFASRLAFSKRYVWVLFVES